MRLNKSWQYSCLGYYLLKNFPLCVFKQAHHHYKKHKKQWIFMTVTVNMALFLIHQDIFYIWRRMQIKFQSFSGVEDYDRLKFPFAILKMLKKSCTSAQKDFGTSLLWTVLNRNEGRLFIIYPSVIIKKKTVK